MKRQYKSFLKKHLSLIIVALLTLTLLPRIPISATTSTPVPKNVLVGYWHNFDNGTGFIRLRDVSPNWDVINISFGEPTNQTSGDIKFTPYNMTESEFKDDVKYLQSKGKKVLLSIGGQNGHVSLQNTQTKDVFVKSTCEIIDRYGLDGLDIDFEGGSLYMNSGNDRDFKNPTSPVIVNTIAALKEITKKYGTDFLLTMAPETFFVQHGRRFYGGINANVDNRVGAYLPVIYALRNELSWLQVQLYNSPVIEDNNGKSQSPGNSEFIVALTDMLLNGFSVNGGDGGFFPALREDQIVVGVPSNPGAAGSGVLTNDQYKEALNALYFGGKAGSYTVKKQHPNLRGIMAWSINWDNFYKNSFSNYFRNYFDTLPPPIISLQAGTVEISATDKKDYTLKATVPSYNSANYYTVYENDKVFDFGQLKAGNENNLVIQKNIYDKEPGNYSYKVVVSDSKNELISNEVRVSIKDEFDPSGSGGGAGPVPNKVLVGYWHNFDNGSGFVRLKDVPNEWDVINLSFGEPTSVTSGDIKFKPYNYTDEDFIKDVKLLQSKGKKITLSIGGQNGQVQLINKAARDNFIRSISEIITKYGLDGLDIDFEGHSLYFQEGDTNYKNPTTPVIVNLIDSLKELTNKFGDDFLLTMAPETFFVQLGHSGYGYSPNGADQRRGSYLPVIYALRDKIDWIQVQYYNSGPITGPDGQYKTMGNADFYGCLAEMLLTGFTVPGNDPFPALREDQVVLGVPACTYAGNGFTSLSTIQSAMDALIKGGTAGNWKMSKAYPNLRGIMAWSINWDMRTQNQFAPFFRKYLDDVSKTIMSLKAPTITTTEQVNGEFTLKITFPAKNTAIKYSIMKDNVSILDSTINASGDNPVTIEKKISVKNEKPRYADFLVTVTDDKNQIASSNHSYVKIINEMAKLDLNGDNKVDARDLAIIADKYNISRGDVGYNLKYDINNDGTIDIYDFVTISKYLAS
ncbi:glycosyl hydrolase family 18 protein [Clostridium sp. LP20]|uniref:glycosyl hydrolase family 18 protein n=1 Tax=Clostridium sp. LP20 TaxID=3418665 RepID=UPI003EE64146